MQVIFYQKTRIVVKFMCNIVRSFFNSWHMLKGNSRTYIIIIPKIANLENINHYWSISLCKISYKIFSRILTIDLKIPLKIVFLLQDVFVQGKDIHDI